MRHGVAVDLGHLTLHKRPRVPFSCGERTQPGLWGTSLRPEPSPHRLVLLSTVAGCSHLVCRTKASSVCCHGNCTGQGRGGAAELPVWRERETEREREPRGVEMPGLSREGCVGSRTS